MTVYIRYRNVSAAFQFCLEHGNLFVLEQAQQVGGSVTNIHEVLHQSAILRESGQPRYSGG